MKYFIKERQEAFGCEGPFEISEIKAKLVAGTVNLDWVAATQIGEVGEGHHEERWITLHELLASAASNLPPPRKEETTSGPAPGSPEPASPPDPGNQDRYLAWRYGTIASQIPPEPDPIVTELREMNKSLRTISIAATVYIFVTIIGFLIALLVLPMSCRHIRQGQPQFQFRIPP